MKRVLPLVLLLFILFTSYKLPAQSCFNIAAGNDTTISCFQSCMDLKALLPDVQTTDDYKVVSIPYNPFPFINATGVIFNPTYIDDRYSSVIYLPFTFCFYGRNYTSCVVGTNGLLTFDTINKNTYNAFIIDRPIPYAGGAPNTGGPYYPRASIMGPYHDIDPQLGNQPYNRRMEYIVEGSAPCRKFVLNFYRIPYFGCNDTINITTQQMVLYEGTGLIDMFIETKPIACTSSTNNGNAILGLQNWDQDKQVSPPNRNFARWSSFHEAWRFIPNGGGSLLNRVELYKNGTLISTGTTSPLGNGLLEATFANICQPENNIAYVVKAFYSRCDNRTIETEASDTVVVSRGLNPVILVVDSARCNGGQGTITFTSPLGANIEYSIDGTNWQSSPVFNAAAGNYNAVARLGASLCRDSAAATIGEPARLIINTNTVNITCINKDGSIDITASGGTPPYDYSINGGISYQAGSNFPNLPVGTYNVVVRDLYGCLVTASTSINFIDTMRLELGNDTSICSGASVTLFPQTNAQTDTFKWRPATWLDYDTAKTPVATPPDTITYYLSAKWGICTRTDSIRVNILHKPVAHAGNDSTICYKTNALLQGWATNTSGPVNFAWSPPDSLNTPDAASTIARMDTTRQFRLTVTDAYGCNFTSSDSMWVIMQPIVPAFAGNDTIAMLNKPHQLLGSGGLNYLWSPAGPLDNPFIQNPKAVLTNDTYFNLLVTDAIGCTAEDGVFVRVIIGPEYHVPNAFTPNGDGLNDVFRPIPSGMRSTAYFRVFNRFGQLVFETNKWLAGWDGTFKGKKAETGTYVWTIKGFDVNGREIQMSGTVILLR